MTSFQIRRKREVLIITDIFPPAGGAGVQFVLKLIKYLNSFNWKPVFLVPRIEDYWIKDESIEENVDFSNIKVIKAFSPKLLRVDQIIAGSNDKKNYKGGKKFVKEVFNFLNKYIVNNLFIPDKRLLWIPFAYFEGRRILNSERIDIIFTISPAYSTILLGLLLKKEFEIPLISYFLDPWTDNPYSADSYFKRFINQRLENYVMGYIDKAIFCTKSFADYMSLKYSNCKEKIFYVPIGFDPEDFKDININNKSYNSYLIITYTGTFYGHRNPYTFFKALSLLLKRNPNLRSKIKIKLIGASKFDIIKIIEEFNLKDIIEIVGYVPWKIAINVLRDSDILLLILGEDDKFFVPGKLYEYLGAGRFILGIGPNGEAKEIVEKSGIGVFFSNIQIEEISDLIYELYLLKTKGEIPINPNLSYISQFYSQNCIKKLTDIFFEVINE
ncbi:MAG: glycosyltransferase [Nitrososphaerota archaeon]